MNSLVLIEWVDSSSASAGWKPIEDCVATSAIVKSVGWLHSKTPETVVIVPHWISEIPPTVPEQICGEMAIPTSAVSIIYYLTDPTNPFFAKEQNRDQLSGALEQPQPTP